MNKKYLYIFEDSTVKVWTDSIPEDDLNACDSGVLQIIDVEELTTYYEGKWCPLETI